MSKTVRIEPDEGTPASKWAQSLVGCVVADRYRVEAVITASDVGAVYRAQHVHLKTRVALKVLDMAAASRDVARFEREGVAGAHIKHPNVAAAMDCGDLPDGGHYLAIEHVPGTTLRDVLKKGPMQLSRALRVARQIALALGATHEQGIVHRNVEPRNVMLTGESGDDVKLIDFGSAKVDIGKLGSEALGSEEDDLTQRTRILTSTGVIEGTTAYLPPEGALGSAVLDTRADLYALGVVLYEMLSGKRPFDAEEALDLFKAQRERDIPRIVERAPDVRVPDEVEEVVRRLLARERDKRYGAAADVAAALDAASNAAVSASTSPSSSETFVTAISRKIPAQARLPLAIAAVVVPLLLVVWIVASAGSSKPTRTERDDDDEVRRPRKQATSTPRSASSASSEPSLDGSAAFVADSADVEAPSAAASEATEAPGVDDLRSTLTQAAKDENWAKAGPALLALVEADPEAFKEGAITGATVSTAVALETVGGKKSDAVFDALATKLGSRGLWILFDIVRTKGGTKGSDRATRMLKDPKVAEKAPVALKVAFELVTAPCSEKAALFPKAAQFGDERAYTALKLLKEMDCPRRNQGTCCFRENKELDNAIEALRVKLGKPKDPKR
ncbi:MAG: serine/threonine protein kinase [Polyangiaceae bacterium]|nr:serine/threonine protein kinase [Polyangiaceae bacterium]